MKHDDFGRPSPDAWFQVRDPKQAKLLSDPKTFRYFAPFIAQERSAKEAAEETKISIELMLYHIKNFLRVGLLEVKRTEARQGRSIKYYRAISDAFFLPLEVTPFADLEERLKADHEKRHELIIHNTARVLREVKGEGRRIFRARNGKIMTESVAHSSSSDPLDDPTGPAAINSDLGVRLTYQEAKALQQELYNIVKRYQEPGQEGSRYLLAVTLLPLSD
jgi:DNA-binding transcriptional ArsR family regulator